MSDDYGYFGSDDEGYAHYTDATERPDDGAEETGGPKSIGCGTAFLIAVVVITFLSAVAGSDFF